MLPSNRSLTRLTTNPVIWFLDIGDKRVSFSTEELQSPMLFQRRCMEAASVLPPMFKKESWDAVLAGMMKHCTVIEIPDDESPQAIFRDLLNEFLDGADESSMDKMLMGIPYKNADKIFFRFKDLGKYIKDQRFEDLKNNQISKILMEMGGRKDYVKLGAKGARVWILPRPEDWDPLPIPEVEPLKESF